MTDTCKRGHPLTPENAYDGPDGKLHCRVCARLNYQKRKADPPIKPDFAELRWRPIEHVMEFLSNNTLAQILGCSKAEARLLRDRPEHGRIGEGRPAEFMLDDVAVKKIRDWLEEQ